ncbi:alpha/beta hydrolase [Pontibacter korlensis]|uniref:alpha/beta hydrolase n=1 Tax=Pontibacter korlensis TaxID=400092 RepID=UPI00061AAB91|nr:alpha/beta hydrolase [Pontibacter korlensis]
MSKVYLISGLGADWRMFQFLKLPEYIPYEHVEWIAPLYRHEPLHEYAQRLKAYINDPEPVLVGLSFGGVVAIELAKLLRPCKTIIISSLANRYDLPTYYRILGSTKLHHWMPFRLMQGMYPLAPFFFGAHTKAERKVLKQAFFEIDEQFLRWALEQMLAWPQEKVLPGLVQIHGTRDLVLPLRDRSDILKIQGGEHLMIMHQADKISAILASILEETWTKADTSLPPLRGNR